MSALKHIGYEASTSTLGEIEEYRSILPILSTHDLAIIIQETQIRERLFTMYVEQRDLEAIYDSNFLRDYNRLYVFPEISREVAIKAFTLALFGHKGDEEMSAYRGILSSHPDFNVIYLKEKGNSLQE